MRFWLSPPEYNFPANGYFEWEVCPGHEIAQPSGISLGITHSECFETRSCTENAFCLAAQSAFLFQGGRDNWSCEALP